VKEFLMAALNRAVSGWDGDFEFVVDPEDDDGDPDRAYFEVTVRLKHRKVEQRFNSKVVRALQAYIEFGEDSWYELDTESLFALLWFDLVNRCEDLS